VTCDRYAANRCGRIAIHADVIELQQFTRGSAVSAELASYVE
jgi:hypothetical protein